MTNLTVEDVQKAMVDMIAASFDWDGEEGTKIWLVYDPKNDDVFYTTEDCTTRDLPRLPFSTETSRLDYIETATEILEWGVALDEGPGTFADYRILPFGFEVPHDVYVRLAELDAKTSKIEQNEEYSANEIAQMTEERAAKLVEKREILDYINQSCRDEAINNVLDELRNACDEYDLLEDIETIAKEYEENQE